MLLAEALSQRADITTRLAELKQRALHNVRHQEGESPAEDPMELLAEFERLTGDLETRVLQINVTNLATEVEPGVTMTAALARRDALRARHRMLAELADGAVQSRDRFTRTELRYEIAVDVRALRQAADDVARRLRELDTRIQQVNWSTELQERRDG
jgi:uncharacterized coiled-coil DUF342 family protein